MWQVDIENIAGIRSGHAELGKGTNIVQASNFQGKSSFLKALQTVMGTTGLKGESHPLTEGAKEGSVTLDTDDDTYEVTLERELPDSVTRSGTPYLTDETDLVCARYFAFLGENNPIRAAVRNQDFDRLTDLLQEPLDLEKIDAKIVQLTKKRDRIEDEIEQAEQAKENLPAVQEAITQLERDIEELTEQREELAEEATETDEVSELQDELSTARSNLERAERRLGQLETQIERKEAELDETETDLEELEVPDIPDHEAEITEIEEEISDLGLRIDLLQDLHRSNDQILTENKVSLVSNIDRSIAGDEFDCWICGSETTREDIEERLTALQRQIDDLKDERSELKEKVRERKEQRDKIERKQRQKENLENRIQELNFEIEEKKDDLERTQANKEELEAKVEELEAKIEELDTNVNDELTSVKAELQTKQQELSQKEEQLDELKSQADEVEELREEKETIRDEITDLRRRKTQKQEEMQDQFDQAMEEIVTTFGPGFDGGGLDAKKVNNEIEKFEPFLARDNRRASLNSLSEGELELVGIITALAAYRTFNVNERVPVIMIDGIGQLAAEHLRNLINHLEGTAEILLTTAYPEAGDFGDHILSPDEWDVVSDETVTAA